jgi:hypothetical protein
MVIGFAKRLYRATVDSKYSTGFTWTAGAGLCWSLYQLIESPPTLLQTVIMVVVCYFLTDLISGLLHVVLDNPRSLEVPPLRSLASGFQAHHENPQTIFEMTLYNHLYVMHLPLTLFFVVLLPFHGSLYYLSYVVMVAMLHLMQMAHRWSHMPAEDVPVMVQRLQRAGLLLSYERHDVHHHPPYAKDFCIMTGMANPLLNVAVRRFGCSSHWWNAAFLAAGLLPLVTAFALTR